MNDKNEGGRAKTRGEGGGEEAARRTERPLCGSEPGSEPGPEPRASPPSHWAPHPPAGLGKELGRRPRLPSLAGFPVNPTPARPRARLQGPRQEARGPEAGGRTRAQPRLPFPVPQFLTRPQGLRRRLFGPEASALPSKEGSRKGRTPGPRPQPRPSEVAVSGSPVPRPAPPGHRSLDSDPCWRGEAGRGRKGPAGRGLAAGSSAEPPPRAAAARPPSRSDSRGLAVGGRRALERTLRTRRGAAGG